MARIPQRPRYFHEARTVPPPTLTPSQRAISTRTFHPFLRLPREIREVIWKLSSYIPRVVEVGFFIAADGTERYPSNSFVPALLHVCSESRDLGLTLYEPFAPVGLWTGAYVNWERDYILPRWDSEDMKSYQGEMDRQPGGGTLCDTAQHVLIPEGLLLSFNVLPGCFRASQHFAILYGIAYGNEEARLNETNLDASADLELFRIQETPDGSVACSVEHDMISPLSDEDKSIILARSSFNDPEGKFTDDIIKAHYVVTPVIAYQRRRERSLSRDSERDELRKEQLRKDFPPPVVVSHCKDWTAHRLEEDFGDLRYDILGDYGEDEYEVEDMRSRLNDYFNRRMLSVYERVFQHFLMEMKDIERFGIQIGPLLDEERVAEDEEMLLWHGYWYRQILLDFEKKCRLQVKEIRDRVCFN